jgi:hypothetical protein
VVRHSNQALGVVIKNAEIFCREVCLFEDEPPWLVVDLVAKDEACAWLLSIQLWNRWPDRNVDGLKSVRQVLDKAYKAATF